MSVDASDCLIVGNRDMTRSNAHQLAILLVGGIDRQVALTLAGLDQQPKVGEGREAGRWDIPQPRPLQVRDQEIGDSEAQKDKGRILRREKHGEDICVGCKLCNAARNIGEKKRSEAQEEKCGVDHSESGER